MNEFIILLRQTGSKKIHSLINTSQIFHCLFVVFCFSSYTSRHLIPPNLVLAIIFCIFLFLISGGTSFLVSLRPGLCFDACSLFYRHCNFLYYLSFSFGPHPFSFKIWNFSVPTRFDFLFLKTYKAGLINRELLRGYQLKTTALFGFLLCIWCSFIKSSEYTLIDPCG